MAWMISEEKLDPNQREIFRRPIDKNLWIKGFAGSGKSVLLIHKLRKLLKDNPNAETCVVVFTWTMIDMYKTGMKELNLPDSIPVITYFQFKNLGIKKYDYIFCDEVQDLPASILLLMKSQLKNNGKLVVAGDSNQSIYMKAPRLNEPTIDPDKIGDVIDADEIGLNYVHRVTRTIINAIQKLLPETNIWSANREFTPSDRSIALFKSPKQEEEVRYVFEEALKGPNSSGRDKMENSVILLPKHEEIVNFIQLLLKEKGSNPWPEKKDIFGKNPDYEDLNRYLALNNIKLQYLGNGKGSLQDAEKNKQVIIMTYHSSKGLDFDNVFLPFLSWDLFISKTKSAILLMVAMTRSKKNLTITYSGNPHSLLEKFINDDNIVTNISVNNNHSDIFDLGDIELGF